jgi:hypothetical protein
MRWRPIRNPGLRNRANESARNFRFLASCGALRRRRILAIPYNYSRIQFTILKEFYGA